MLIVNDDDDVEFVLNVKNQEQKEKLAENKKIELGEMERERIKYRMRRKV